jgi:hypothetical protein
VVSSTYYRTAITAPVLGGFDPDSLTLEFFSPAVGSFDLAGDNFATCNQCLLAYADEGVGPLFFQDSGTLELGPGSQPLNSVLDATLIDVTLVEVTIDPLTFVSTPVPGGYCLHINREDLSTAE